MALEKKEIERIVDMALTEDVGQGDITSSITIPADSQAEFTIITRQELVVCGLDVAYMVFDKFNHTIKKHTDVKDGDVVKANTVLMRGSGNAHVIMAAERVALNLMQQCCAVATFTRACVDAIKGTNAKVLDTRKTIPGLRSLQKYAVTVGGGHNHRFRLDDGILIKDNHISICGGVTAALEKARKSAPKDIKIEIECDTLEQVGEAIAGKADIIMLDNMNTGQLKQAVKIVGGLIPLEASGNVNLKTIKSIADTGVDFISIGKITHSPPTVDIALEII